MDKTKTDRHGDLKRKIQTRHLAAAMRTRGGNLLPRTFMFSSRLYKHRLPLSSQYTWNDVPPPKWPILCRVGR